MSEKVRKHGWSVEIQSPFNFVSGNWYTSDKVELFHNDCVSIYTFNKKGKTKPRSRMTGIQMKDEYSNDKVDFFHSNRFNNSGF